MADQKPPKLDDTERATLLALWDFQRDSFVRKVAGVGDDAARAPMVPSGTSLLWLTKHMALAEAIWVVRRFAGSDEPLPDDRVQPGDTVRSALAAYERTRARVDDIVSRANDLDARCADPDNDAAVNLRWVLMHLLEETARHAGHADILRELVDGATGR